MRPSDGGLGAGAGEDDDRQIAPNGLGGQAFGQRAIVADERFLGDDHRGGAVAGAPRRALATEEHVAQSMSALRSSFPIASASRRVGGRSKTRDSWAGSLLAMAVLLEEVRLLADERGDAGEDALEVVQRFADVNAAFV